MEIQYEMFINRSISPEQTGTNQQNVYTIAFCLPINNSIVSDLLVERKVISKNCLKQCIQTKLWEAGINQKYEESDQFKTLQNQLSHK